VMTKESIKGDIDPYSAWHRTLPQWLGLMDMDAIEYNGQVTLSVYLEYNKNDYEVHASIEVVNINSKSGGDLPAPPDKFPTEYPIDDAAHRHKKEVLVSYTEKTAFPVFVVWVCWGDVQRGENNVVERAEPKAFYVKELPERGETDMAPSKFKTFLKHLRGLETQSKFPFASV